MQNKLFILTGNQRIHLGLFDPPRPTGDLFYLALQRKRTKVLGCSIQQKPDRFRVYVENTII